MHFRTSVRLASFFWLAGILFMLAGCATPPPADDPDAVAEFNEINDPLEPMNRKIFAFNEVLDDYVLAPAAKTYRFLTPRFLRQCIADALDNLKSPLIFGNDLLQGNVSRAGVTLARFAVNSSLGLGGLIDIAKPMGLPKHASDLGETLAVWGVGEGFYLVLPLFGPYNPRDAFGLGAETFLDPLTYYLDDNKLRWASTTRFLLSGVSTREAYLDTIDDIKRTSLDYYSAMRSLKRQSRDAQIREALSGAWKIDESRNR
jgi:phospholipid-binding lipoprotein MlaA